MNTCKICNKQFEPTFRHPKQKYCHVKCLRKAGYNRVKNDPVKWDKLNKTRGIYTRRYMDEERKELAKLPTGEINAMKNSLWWSVYNKLKVKQ